MIFMSGSHLKINKMDRILTTLQEMMADRNQTGWEQSQICENVYLTGNILIMISGTEKFNIDTMKKIILQLQEHQKSHAIVVYQNMITSLAKKAIEHIHEYTIETFEKKELQYNPTHHRLYCPHLRIPTSQVRKEISADLNSLPVLLRTDVISRYFGFQKGDVIRIDRKNGSVAYRFVK